MFKVKLEFPAVVKTFYTVYTGKINTSGFSDYTNIPRGIPNFYFKGMPVYPPSSLFWVIYRFTVLNGSSLENLGKVQNFLRIFSLCLAD